MLNKIYEKSPHTLQGFFLNAYALGLQRQRFGKPFHRVLDFLLESQWYDRARIEEYQASAFLRLVSHAYENISYYREVMDARGLKPRDFKGLEDISKLPILEKDTVRADYQRLLSQVHKAKDLGIGRTSGTTGSPLQVSWDRSMQIFNNAVDWRQKCWAGVGYGSKIALILGRPIVAIERVRPPFWQHNFIHRQLWMSAFHMSPTNLDFYLDKLKQYKPDAIEGYPSTLFTLAKYLNSKGTVLKMKAAFCSSEPLFSFQREEIEQAFACKVYDFYGSAERVVFATQCDQHVGQHVNFEFGMLELLDEDGQPVDEGKDGFMVATSLQNYGMPLLRYRLSDKTSFFVDACKCGRSMPRIKCVETKAEDNIMRTDGTVISPSILTHPFKPIKNLVKSQIIQHSATRIEIIAVTRPEFSTQDEDNLLFEFRRRVGPEFEVFMTYCDDIPAGANGKFRWVINRANQH